MRMEESPATTDKNMAQEGFAYETNAYNALFTLDISTGGTAGASHDKPDLTIKKKKLPPFVIFLETSLEDMATQYPTTLAELEKISGVSKGKAIRYGQTFVDLIAKYVAENDITKPDEFVMRSVVNKSGDKVFIIQQVDKKVGLDTIAKNRDMKMEQLLEVMETIVASGTKLNLDYAIDQMVDEDDQEDILDYFKSCETSSLDVAKEELSDLDLEWEQLKIMRIKFLSVYGM